MASSDRSNLRRKLIKISGKKYFVLIFMHNNVLKNLTLQIKIYVRKITEKKVRSTILPPSVDFLEDK